MKKFYDDEDKNTTSYRIRTAREEKDWKQKDLAGRLHISPSQVSRWERGETTNISSSMLAAMAKELEVSSDYLLCLTPITTPKSYDISQLGLSTNVVEKIIRRAIDPDILNRLLGHKDFPGLCVLMKNYFYNTTANGLMARNELIDLAIDPLTELMSTEPSKRVEILKDRSFLNSQKIQGSEAAVEKIKNVLMKIIRDIKIDMETGEQTGAIATADAVKRIRAALPDKPPSELTVDDMSSAIAAYVETVLPMDKSSSALLKQLTKQIMQPSTEAEK